MDFFRRHRVLSFLMFTVLLGVLVARIVAPRFLTAQTASPTTPSTQISSVGSGVCSKVGNNAAIQFDNPEISFDEASYTLALYTGAKSEESAIIDAIKSSSGTIIIRLGAGQAAKGPPAPEYIAALKRISSAVGGKTFIATVGHNEANCAEKEDAIKEGSYMSAVISGAKGTPGLKLISGQIDYYCGTEDPKAYIKYLPLAQLDGIALPFYTGVAGGADATVAKLQEFMNVVGGKDIYITESGPFKGEFSDFANAVKTIANEPRIKAVLLFNAFGTNTDPAFTYTKPFWNPDCREALRTVCQDPTAVVEACNAPPSNYFEYNIGRKSVSTLLSNFAQDYSVACMPQESFKLVAKNREQCGVAGIGCGQWNFGGELSLSAQGKLFGLFRNEKAVNNRISANKAPQKRTESLETYLGVPNTHQPSATGVTPTIPKPSPSTKDLSSNQGPVYSLTSLEEQCQLVIDKLDAVNNLCNTNRIEGDKAKCGLNTRIAGTDDTHLTLRSKVQNKTCAQLMNPDPSNALEVKLRDTILATPLAMETAYRPAFIVAVTKFEKPTDNMSVNSPGVPTAPGEEFYTVDYLEVKVPAFGSDFLPNNSNNSSGTGKNGKYQDPLQVTANVLSSKQDQDTFYQKVNQDRDKLRGAVSSVPVKGGLVGNNGNSNIYCFMNGSWKVCRENPSDPVTKPDEAGPDKLPIALASFLNAYNNAGIAENGLNCNQEEAQFYSPRNAKKIAETVTSIGSDLGTKEKTGVFTKKQNIKIPYNVSVNSIADKANLTFNTTTQLYFISPHNSNLEFAKESFYNFLTIDEQQKLKSLGLADDTGFLSPEKFSPLLKTEIDDKFTANATTRTNDRLTPPVSVSVGLENNVDDQNKPQKHPLFWQFAGQVSNLPTRLMALLTSTTDSSIHKFTLNCTDSDDPETLSHATENWLLGKCEEKTTTTQACTAKDPKKVTTAEFHGASSQITDGVIATALEVSKYTCTPAEVLIGVMAKESRGLTNVNGVDQPASGDPKEIITRQVACNSLNPNDSSADIYYRACGAYQYAQANIRDQIATYGAPVTNCLSKIVGGDIDTRELGVSMCVAGVNIWRSTYCTKNPGACTYSSRGGNYGCDNEKGLSLKEYFDQGYTKGHFFGGIAAFHGNNEANENYWAFVEQYTAAVEAVRSQLVCKQ
jgi:hypothetical protein